MKVYYMKKLYITPTIEVETMITLGMYATSPKVETESYNNLPDGEGINGKVEKEVDENGNFNGSFGANYRRFYSDYDY